MTWRKLVEKGSLKPKKISLKEIDATLSKAGKCAKASAILFTKKLPENAFKEAYDAMIIAGRALIFSLGYKPYLPYCLAVALL